MRKHAKRRSRKQRQSLSPDQERAQRIKEMIKAGHTANARDIGLAFLKQHADQQSIFTLNMLGKIHRYAKQYDAALPYLKRAVQADPKNVPSLVLLGQTYLDLKDFNTAWDTLESARQLSPNHMGMRCGFCIIDIEQERFEKAEKFIYGNLGLSRHTFELSLLKLAKHLAEQEYKPEKYMAILGFAHSKGLITPKIYNELCLPPSIPCNWTIVKQEMENLIAAQPTTRAIKRGLVHHR